MKEELEQIARETAKKMRCDNANLWTCFCADCEQWRTNLILSALRSAAQQREETLVCRGVGLRETPRDSRSERHRQNEPAR